MKSLHAGANLNDAQSSQQSTSTAKAAVAGWFREPVSSHKWNGIFFISVI